MAKTPAAKLDEAMSGEYGSYCHIYETPFIYHLAIVAVAINRHDDVNVMATSAAPQESVLEVLRTLDVAYDDRPLHEALTSRGLWRLCKVCQREPVGCGAQDRACWGMVIT